MKAITLFILRVSKRGKANGNRKQREIVNKAEVLFYGFAKAALKRFY
jgi:hypothetical protein